MDVPILQKLGLSTNEIRTYLALLELGRTTSGPLIKKTKLNSAKVYENLAKLQSKGLAGYINNQGKRFFEASSPKRFLDIIEEKKEQLNRDKLEFVNVLPRLNLLQKNVGEVQTAAIYHDPYSYKLLVENMLDELGKGGSYISISSVFRRKVDPFWYKFQDRKRSMRVTSRVIWGSNILQDKDYVKNHR